MDTVKRSIVKTIFFKIVTTSVTACITGLGKALIIHLLMTIIYLIYELVWRKIKWGTKPDVPKDSDLPTELVVS